MSKIQLHNFNYFQCFLFVSIIDIPYYFKKWTFINFFFIFFSFEPREGFEPRLYYSLRYLFGTPCLRRADPLHHFGKCCSVQPLPVNKNPRIAYFPWKTPCTPSRTVECAQWHLALCVWFPKSNHQKCCGGWTRTTDLQVGLLMGFEPTYSWFPVRL